MTSRVDPCTGQTITELDYSGADSFGSGGMPGMVLVTLAPGANLDDGINGGDYAVETGLFPGQTFTKWIWAYQYRTMKADGLVM